MEYIKSLTMRSLRTGLLLIKLMLPVMILMRVLDQFGLSDALGAFIGPAMALFGLPPEAGIIWTISLLVGTYPALGAIITLMPTMDLNVAQMSVLSSMILFAHMIPTEQIIAHRAGASFTMTSIFRILAAVLYGIIANQILVMFDLLQQPLVIAWTPEGFASDGWYDWAIATAQSMVIMILIIMTLFLLLDLFEKIGVSRLLTHALSPPFDYGYP